MSTCFIINVDVTKDLLFKKKLFNFYNIHKMIWELWGNLDKAPFIFRMIDNNLFILATKKIENTKLDWLKYATISEEIDFNLEGIYSYDIVVNPVKKDSKNKKLIPLKKEEDIIKWWEEKGKRNGFKISTDNIIVYNKQNNINTSKNMTIFTANIRGVLKITDTKKFNENYIKGFGKAKRFGCGVLMLSKKIY